jgi:hypothetical protein
VVVWTEKNEKNKCEGKIAFLSPDQKFENDEFCQLKAYGTPNPNSVNAKAFTEQGLKGERFEFVISTL